MRKWFKKLKKRGIRYRRMNYFMLGVAILITIAMFLAMQRTSSIYDETYEVTQNLSKWRTSAYDLQVGSDYLTEQIRGFVVTGNRAYLDNYFTEVNVTQRRDNALKEIESHRTYVEALDNIRRAMAESRKLMGAEYTAARLTVMAYGLELNDFPEEIREAEIEATDLSKTDDELKARATDLVFGEYYRKEKEIISDYMQKCMDALTRGIEADQEIMAKKLESQVLFEHLLTVLMILIMLGIVFVGSRLIVKPLRNAVRLIREEEDLPMKGAFEIRFLAKTYNLMNHRYSKSQEKLSYEATHDELTGLYNRRGYDFLLDNIDVATSALMLIDLDKFKNINDENGHDVGDKVLVTVAEVLNTNFRSQDYICRLGGDEMAVIVTHANPSLTQLLRDKVKNINHSLQNQGEDFPASTISAGVAFGEEDMSIEKLFKHADEALYEAKERGRSDVQFYHEMKDQLWMR